MNGPIDVNMRNWIDSRKRMCIGSISLREDLCGCAVLAGVISAMLSGTHNGDLAGFD